MSSSIEVFEIAKNYIISNYPSDIETAMEFLKINLDEVDKTFFMRQYIHVVYCSGFKYQIVSDRWNDIEDVYYYFDPPSIVLFTDTIREEAMKIIGHRKKIEAILSTAKWLNILSEDKFKQFLQDAKKNIDLFKQLNYIGDITKYHLALCLGFDVSKPDVHITRIANRFNEDPLELCETLSKKTGYPVRIVDAILWRAAERGVI